MQDSPALYLPLILFIALLVLSFRGARRRQRNVESKLQEAQSPESATSAPQLPLHFGRFRLPFGIRAVAWCVVFGAALLGLFLGRPEFFWSTAVILAPWVVEQAWEYRNPTLTLTDTLAIYRRSMLHRLIEIPLRSVQSWGFSTTLLVLLRASAKPIAIPVGGFSQAEVERLVSGLSALLPARRDDATAEVVERQ